VDALGMMSNLALNGIATGVLSLTLTRSTIFRRPRVWVRYHIGNWAGELARCPYCMSHWIAAGLVAWAWPGSWHVAVLEWLAAVAIAAPTAAIAYESIVRITPNPSEALYAEPEPESTQQAA
jgi:hypothetical protein